VGWLKKSETIGMLLLVGQVALELNAQESLRDRGPRVNVFVDPFLPYGQGHRGTPRGTDAKPYTRIRVIDRTPSLPLSPDLGAFTKEVFRQQCELAFSRAQYDQAVRFAHHALIEDSNDGRLHLLLSHSFFASGEYQGAAHSLVQGLGLLDQKDWGHFLVAGSRFYATGEHARRLRHLDAFIRSNSRNAHAYLLRGYHRLFSGESTAAQVDLESAILLNPELHFAKQLLALNQHQDALEMLPPPPPRSEESQRRQ
jgi:tetratricopeptide (TPR) repeat protein